MMLEHLKPERVFYYFEEISKIPRGSYNTKQVSDYCVSVAHELGLAVRQDSLNNVVIKKPASKGYEHAPVLMLQGHLDMVCEKESGVKHDFEHDGLDLMITEDGYVTADGTTLGGDDGIAVAIALAILEDDSLIHPPLEVVFTTEEEVGMDGALGLDPSDLYAKYLLNLDSEDEGILTVSCAGGSTVELHLPYEAEESNSLSDNDQIYMLKIQGLQGGHSGVEIDKGRANSNKLMAVLLQDLAMIPNLNYRLISVQGGLKHNAIPRETIAYLTLQSEADVKQITGSIGRYQQLFQKCYGSADPTIEIIFESCGMEYMVKNGHVPVNYGDGQDFNDIRVMTRACSDRLIRTLYLLPNGVQAMSQEIPGLPET
ncbi:MAG: beta-Ala-His dipeptidase, partial [Lachnospiraceae bacterium]|nr:beta-Ala-His dipeptidase [Lachnospiraceae bacterium]